VPDGKVGEGGDVVGRVVQHGFDPEELAAEHPGDYLQLLADLCRAGLGEDGADGRGGHLRGALWDLGQDIGQEEDPAALPVGAQEHRADHGFEPDVRVGDDQLDAVQTAGLQRAQERGPERAVLAGAHVEAGHFACPSGATPVANTTA